eukprot:TRINITY_DN1962_c0_g1_i2.p2 TRINITY_DN1962_c0_g1~~TRINITY_DN1962_c0_g1_i2.p2  ORF type:complete len:310 (-),score=95.33 TRINITY_DN1962_c0_g1_i2:1010-1849(-)
MADLALWPERLPAQTAQHAAAPPPPPTTTLQVQPQLQPQKAQPSAAPPDGTTLWNRLMSALVCPPLQAPTDRVHPIAAAATAAAAAHDQKAAALSPDVLEGAWQCSAVAKGELVSARAATEGTPPVAMNGGACTCDIADGQQPTMNELVREQLQHIGLTIPLPLQISQQTAKQRDRHRQEDECGDELRDSSPCGATGTSIDAEIRQLEASLVRVHRDTNQHKLRLRRKVLDSLDRDGDVRRQTDRDKGVARDYEKLAKKQKTARDRREASQRPRPMASW